MIGLGYIGLPTAAHVRAQWHGGVGVDVDAARRRHDQPGEIHIVEPDLTLLHERRGPSGKLRATTTPGLPMPS